MVYNIENIMMPSVRNCSFAEVYSRMKVTRCPRSIKPKGWPRPWLPEKRDGKENIFSSIKFNLP